MKTKQLIYSIEGLDAELLYTNYLTFLDDQRSTRDFTPGDSPVVNAVAEQYLKDFKFKDPGKPNKNITINKFRVLVHMLISRNHERDVHNLNSEILKHVIGPHYSLMIRSMVVQGILSKSDFYLPGIISHRYTLNEPYEVKIRQNNNVYIQKDIERLDSIFVKIEDHNREKWNQDNFIKQYQINLSKVKLSKYDYHKFVELLPYSARSKVTYYEVLEKLNNKYFNLSEDNRYRLYSTLTRTPKLLKNFLSIKFQIDINNSHPLLFSYFIINKYNINFNIIQDINSITYYNNIIYHDVGQYLYKKLKTSTQDFIKKHKIPTDVILYIYLTSTGRFWDHFKTLPEFNHVPRYLIKVKLFEEVFYSNKLTSWHREAAKAFKSIYPTVYSEILLYRKEANDKKGEHLAHKMTKLESEIFRQILQHTWGKGWETVNIHDALVVIDTKKNESCNVEQIEQIIKNVYREYGLISTTSVDYFNIDKAKREVQVLKENQNKISELKNELHQTALYATDDVLFQRTIDLMSGLDDGSIEVVFEGGNPYLIYNN